MADKIDVDLWKSFLDKMVKDRHWDKAHNPKNMAMDILNEASELSENYTWVNTEDSFDVHLDKSKLENIRHELGDILMGVIMMADLLDINLSESLTEKFEYTKRKYPVKF